MRRYKTYINGEWFEGTSGIVLRSVDPSNNKELGEIVQNKWIRLFCSGCWIICSKHSQISGQ